MYSKFIQSIFYRPIALLLAVTMLSLSFTTAGSKVSVPAGTGIMMELVNTASSDYLLPGDVLDFRVLYDVKVSGQTVIKAGTIARGQVVRVKQRGAIGRAGQVTIKLRSVQAVDGQELVLSGGEMYQEGEDKQALSIVLGIFVCVLCLLIKGNDAVIPAGTQINPMVASETQVVVYP